MQDLPGVSAQTARNMGGWTTTRMVETYSSPAEASLRVCGQHGPRRLRLAPAVAPPNPLPRLPTAIVQAHLGPGDWQVAAIAPLAQWPRSLKRELGATLGALGDTVVLVLERVP